MIKPAFDINFQGQQADMTDQHSSLLIELSEKQISCLRVNRTNHQLYQLKQYHLSTHGEETVAEVLNELIESADPVFTSASETHVVYNFSESTLLPEESFSVENSKQVNEFVTGNAHKGLVLSEKIQGWSIYNIYRVPRELHSLVQRKFTSGKYWHFYSLLLSGIVRGSAESNSHSFHIFFYPEKFVVSLSQNSKLYLVQTYQYQVPEDVEYYLLKICNQYDIDPGQVQLFVGGLIDSESALYSEISRYFMNIQWLESEDNNWKNEAYNDFPPHYFSPLLQMALCV